METIENPIVAGAHSSDALKVGDKKVRRGNPFAALFLPNRAVTSTSMKMLVLVEIALAFLVWLNSPFKVLPRPDEVFHALVTLWTQRGLGQEVMSSLQLNVVALFWTVLISSILCYLTVIPVFRPIVAGISKGRFLSLVGFTFIFTLIWGGGAALKNSLLVFGMTVFYVTSMASVIAAIPKSSFDHARSLQMSEWRVVWEVVVLGTIDKAFEVMRQNAAIGWMMLTMVEGIVRSQGGVGAMLLNEQKHFLLAEVFAIQIVILIVGLLLDMCIGLLRKLVCPYADLTMERK